MLQTTSLAQDVPKALMLIAARPTVSTVQLVVLPVRRYRLAPVQSVLNVSQVSRRSLTNHEAVLFVHQMGSILTTQTTATPVIPVAEDVQVPVPLLAQSATSATTFNHLSALVVLCPTVRAATQQAHVSNADPGMSTRLEGRVSNVQTPTVLNALQLDSVNAFYATLDTMLTSPTALAHSVHKTALGVPQQLSAPVVSLGSHSSGRAQSLMCAST